MMHVPIDDEVLDVAIFSLSLMGSNLTDYLLEGREKVRPEGA